MNSPRHQRQLALPRGRRSLQLARSSRFESLEDRIVLDGQVGTVTMPYNGYLSAGIYDSNGQLIRTLLARQAEVAGPVTLTWDGRDDLGRAVIQDGTYTWKALTSQVEAVDNGAVGDSLFDPSSQTPNAGYFVQSLAVNLVGGTSGDVGGTFARNDNESYYGDTNLSQTFDLNTPVSASGTFFVSDPDTMQGKAFIGHFSSSTDPLRREFMGLEFTEGDFDQAIGIRARIFRFNGDPVSDAYSNAITVLPGTGYYNWDYTYDPNFESDASHAGPEGRLTVHIYNNRGNNFTLYADNAGTHRDAGSTFDAFGMGITTQQAFTGDDPNSTAKIFMDDVTYSGHSGLVNFETNPNWTAVGNTTDGNNYGWNQYANIDDSLFTASYVEEGFEINKLGQDGSTQWVSGDALNVGIAADDKYTYVTRNENGEDHLYRYFSRDGGPAPFFAYPAPGYIVVNANAPDPIPSGNQAGDQTPFAYTSEQWRMLSSASGVAADGHRVWVTNYRDNKVQVYDRDTGALLGQFSITKPMAIAMDTFSAGSSTVWVTNNGDRATKLTFNGSTFSATTSITSLSDPTGITIGGPNHHLFVAESGLTRIDEYDISGSPVLAGLQHFGSLHVGGTPLGDMDFYWDIWGDKTSLAIDSTGILSVNDDHRVQRFYTVTGGGHTAGEVYQSISSEFVPAPVQTYNYSADGKHYLVSNRYVYEVDPNYTGGPRAGWMGDGTWRLVTRFYNNTIESNGAPAQLVTLMDGGTPRNYLYMLTRSGMGVFSIDGGQRLSAILGSTWTGVDRSDIPIYNTITGQVLGGQFNWTDTDGDGQIDWNGVGSGNNDGEVNWLVPNGQLSQLYNQMAPWVDASNGDVWGVDSSGNIIKVSVESFDAQHNPIYNWAHATIVIPYNDTGLGFLPRSVRVAANGDIFATGNTRVGVGLGGIIGGDWVARYDSSGNQLLLQPTSQYTYAGITLDQNDPTPDYYFTGGLTIGYMYSNDGLLIDTFNAGPTHGGPGGWMDYPYAIGAFTHPITGQLYVYGEDSYLGKSNRWQINNLGTIQRQQGNFNYAHPTGPSGEWNFENNLNDSVGTVNGTFVGGVPSYAAGKVGANALNLDGVDDYVTLFYATEFIGYTVGAWVKASDTTSVSIIDRSNVLDPNHNNVMDQLRISATGRFEHYTLDGNTSHTVIGATLVQPNTWYYVAITASNDGYMHLYVNGVEEGTPVPMSKGFLSTAGNGFNVGRAVSAQGMGYFAGQIDDLRVYNYPLTLSEIQALSGTAVNVTATDNTAREAGPDTGTFTISRTTTTGDLVVNFVVSGTATNGTDYVSIPSSVTIPNGQSSVTVTVTPIDDAVVDPSETVVLTLTPSANYLLAAPSSDLIVILDNEGGTAGQAGGTFALSDQESYYGDTHLSQTFTLETPISASGVFYVSDPETMHGKFFMGHFSSSTDPSRREFMGLDFVEGDFDGAVGVRARINRFNGDPVSDAISPQYLTLTPAGGPYPFDYYYDPSYESDASHAGPEGRLTVHLYDKFGTLLATMYADNAGTHRDAGSTFDAFGMGLTYTPPPFGASNPSSTAKMFADDLTYSGHTGVEHFNGDPGWTGVGNTSNGHNYGLANQTLNLLNVTAADPSAAEQSANTGTFLIDRGITAGALTVFYTITGTATNGSDYSTIAGSVTIPNGSSTATVTVTPIDDANVESSETVILTLNTNANYTIGAPTSATVTIADNDAAPAASVADRQIFYNNSAWDGNAAGAGVSDDGAIAPDKSVLRAAPGQTVTATFANYTSFSKGINGIMVDIQGLPGGASSTIAASDFIFKTGNNNTPSGWAPAPDPASVTVRAGVGTGGSDRVTLIWTDWDPVLNPANEAIAKAWLQVTVKATAATGLSAADVFYVGNAVGENGGVGGTNTVAGVATITPSDELHARANPKSLLNPAIKENVDDFNRDKQVNPADQLIARSNQTSGLNGLKLIAVTNPSAAPGFAPLAAPSAPDTLHSSDVVTETGSTDTSLTFGLTVSGATGGLSLPKGSTAAPSGATAGLSSSASSVVSSGHAGSSGTQQHPALPVLSASPQQIRQAIRDALRELHCSSKEAVDEDLLEVLGRRIANRN